jgi:DNA ligase-1
LQAWRNQSRMPTNARSCKHLRALLGDAYEDARLKLKNPDGDTFGQNSRAKPASKAKGKGKTAASPRNKKAAGGDDDDEDDDEDAPKKKVPELLLANKWDLDDGPDPTGWWMSEKLDGVRYAAFSRMLCVMLISDPPRTYWDGKQMLSRLGNPFTPPDWFLESMSGRRGIFLRIDDSSRTA